MKYNLIDGKIHKQVAPGHDWEPLSDAETEALLETVPPESAWQPDDIDPNREPPTSKQPTCETCRFCVLFIKPNGDPIEDAGFGTCKRYPPIQDYYDRQKQPLMRLTDWCGEHQPREGGNDQ